jgi:1-phosphatidylinositol-4-phosphate 5-kinase
VFKAGEGAGRSGSFFFFSNDSRFIVKTMSKGELKFFLTILPQYTQHLELNPNSLLAKILGVFTVQQKATDPVFVMLMENTLRVAD